MSEQLLDTPLPFPLMYRPDEHPEAFKMMLTGKTKVPQLLKLWMNFDACYELHSKLFRGAMFMDRGPSGIYMLEVPAWKMHVGYEPRLTETNVSRIVTEGGALAAPIAEEQKEREEDNG